MISNRIDRATARSAWSQQAIGLSFAKKDYEGNLYVSTDLTFEKLAHDDFREPKEIFLAYDAAQELMDALWGCKIRPTEGVTTEGELAQAHLHINSLKKQIETMESIIFKLLEETDG